MPRPSGEKASSTEDRFLDSPPKEEGVHTIPCKWWVEVLEYDLISFIWYISAPYFRFINHIMVDAVAQNDSCMNCRPVASNLSISISDSCLLSHTKFWTIKFGWKNSLWCGFFGPSLICWTERLPSRELTYPTNGKGNSSSQLPLGWDMLVSGVVASSFQLPHNQNSSKMPGNRKLILPTWRHSLHVWGIPRFFALPLDPVSWEESKR